MSYITKQAPQPFTGAGLGNYMRNLTTANNSEAPASINLTFRPSYESLPQQFMSTSPALYVQANSSVNTAANTWTPIVQTSSETISWTNSNCTVGTLGPFPYADIVEFDDSTNCAAEFSGANSAQITTGDFALELIVRTPAPSKKIIYKGGSAAAGWKFETQADGDVDFVMHDGTNSATATHTAGGLSANGASWCHLMVLCDRSSATGLITYLNGVAGTPVDPTNVADSLTTADVLKIGDQAAGSGPFAIAHLAYYPLTGLDINAAVNTAILNRFLTLSGFNASNATTITVTSGTTYPTGFSYDSDLNTGRLLRMSKNWVPVSRDSVSHYLRVNPINNEIMDLAPDDSPNGYTLVNCTVSTAFRGPDGAIKARKIIPDSGTKTRAFAYGATSAGGAEIKGSFFVRANGISTALFQITDGTLSAGRDQYLNLTNGAVTTNGTLEYYRVQRIGPTPDLPNNPWWKVTFKQTAVTGHYMLLGAADAAGARTITGDGTKGVDFFGAGVSASNPTVMDSVYVESANTNRSTADTVRLINSNDWCLDTQGAISCNVYYPIVDCIADHILYDLSDGGSANDRIRVTITASDDNLDVATTATGGNAGAATQATNAAAGAVVNTKVTWQTNNLILRCNNTNGTADTEVDVPNDLDRLDLYGYIKNIAIRNR